MDLRVVEGRSVTGLSLADADGIRAALSFTDDKSVNPLLADTKGEVRLGVVVAPEIGGGIIFFDANGEMVWNAP